MINNNHKKIDNRLLQKQICLQVLQQQKKAKSDMTETTIATDLI